MKEEKRRAWMLLLHLLLLLLQWLAREAHSQPHQSHPWQT